MWDIYECLYIKNVSEDEVSQKLGFISTEKNKKPGYARIQQLKRSLLKIAKEVRDKMDFY